MRWMKLYAYGEVGLLVLVLVLFGVGHFARLSPQQQREIELEAGLEQLYLLQQAHFAEHDRYFDTADPAEGLDWQWMENYDWEFRGGADNFWLVVKADLNSDGQFGIWGVDSYSPQVRRLVDD